MTVGKTLQRGQCVVRVLPKQRADGTLSRTKTHRRLASLPATNFKNMSGLVACKDDSCLGHVSRDKIPLQACSVQCGPMWRSPTHNKKPRRTSSADHQQEPPGHVGKSCHSSGMRTPLYKSKSFDDVTTMFYDANRDFSLERQECVGDTDSSHHTRTYQVWHCRAIELVMPSRLTSLTSNSHEKSSQDMAMCGLQNKKDETSGSLLHQLGLRSFPIVKSDILVSLPAKDTSVKRGFFTTFPVSGKSTIQVVSEDVSDEKILSVTDSQKEIKGCTSDDPTEILTTSRAHPTFPPEASQSDPLWFDVIVMKATESGFLHVLGIPKPWVTEIVRVDDWLTTRSVNLAMYLKHALCMFFLCAMQYGRALLESQCRFACTSFSALRTVAMSEGRHFAEEVRDLLETLHKWPTQSLNLLICVFLVCAYCLMLSILTVSFLLGVGDRSDP